MYVTLPEGLGPVALPDLACTSSGGGTATYAGATEFPFSPFLAYGRFTRFASPDAEVYLLGDPGEECASFLLASAHEVRQEFEAWLGAPGLERAKIVAV